MQGSRRCPCRRSASSASQQTRSMCRQPLSPKERSSLPHVHRVRATPHSGEKTSAKRKPRPSYFARHKFDTIQDHVSSLLRAQQSVAFPTRFVAPDCSSGLLSMYLNNVYVILPQILSEIPSEISSACAQAAAARRPFLVLTCVG